MPSFCVLVKRLDGFGYQQTYCFDIELEQFVANMAASYVGQCTGVDRDRSLVFQMDDDLLAATAPRFVPEWLAEYDAQLYGGACIE